MIKVSVRTTWQGKVGLNEEKYIKPALNSGQALYITNEANGETMIIPAMDLVTAQVSRSEHKFRDKYGKDDYYLVYYKWEPMAKQAAML